jgi:GntR family transcriptional repressor for pyruvate dehydrogenase complex
VADQLRRRILLGDLRPGTRLPSERALADAFAVSLPTIQAAVAALTFCGLLTARHGIGVFVTTKLRSSRLLPISLRRATPHELHALRRDLELAALTRACERRTDRDLQLLWFASSELRVALIEESAKLIPEADLEFHHLLVGAAKSALLSNLHRAVGVRLRGELMGRAALIRRDAEMHAAHIAVLDDLERSAIAALTRDLVAVLASEAPQP